MGAAEMSGSPRSGEVSPRTPSALRNELAAAKKAVELLKAEKTVADEKLEKVQAILDKERNALRDVLATARAKVDELTDELKLKKDEIFGLQNTVKDRDAEIQRLLALLRDQKPAQVNTEQFTTQIANLQRTIQQLQTTNAESDMRSRQRISQLERDLAAKEMAPAPVPGQDAELMRLKQRVSQLEKELAAKENAVAPAAAANPGQDAALRDELAKQRDINQDQMQRLNDLQRSGGDKEAMMKQLSSLREQLQSQSKLFGEQMDNARKREEDLREQLVKQRSELNGEVSDLRQQLSRAMENENVHKVDQLSKMLMRIRHECSLRLANIQLLRARNITFVCFFHFWAHHTQQVNSEKRLSNEARYKLEQARLKAEGKLSQFAATPLDHKKHMQTRHEAFDTHRYELWDNMAPRGGRGDGRDGSVSQSPRSTPSSSPMSRNQNRGAKPRMNTPILGRTLT